MQSRPSSEWLPTYAGVTVGFGVSFALTKLALGSFSPFGVAAVRVLGAVAVLAVVSVATKTALPPRETWGPIFFNALITATVPWLLFGLSVRYISSSLAAIMASSIPILALAFIVLLFPEELPSRKRVAGLVLGFGGVLIVSGFWRGLGPASWIGVGLTLLASSSYSLSLPFTRRYLAGGSRALSVAPLSLATATLAMATLQILPFTAFVDVTDGSMSAGPALAALALGCSTAMAYLLNFRLIGLSDATVASTVSYVAPFVAVVLGVVVLGEALAPNEVLGGLIILAGAAMAQGLFGRRPR